MTASPLAKDCQCPTRRATGRHRNQSQPIASIDSRPCQASWRLRQAAGHIARWHGSGACRDGPIPASDRAVTWPGGVAASPWSASGLSAARALRRLEPSEERVEACGESLVAVGGPDVLADGGQRRESVGWQGPEESVQLAPGRGVLDALLVDGGAVAPRRGSTVPSAATARSAGRSPCPAM
jgi:hypothetical protein